MADTKTMADSTIRAVGPHSGIIFLGLRGRATGVAGVSTTNPMEDADPMAAAADYDQTPWRTSSGSVAGAFRERLVRARQHR